jgi:hypothetical protein
MAKSSRPAGSLNEPAADMGILLDASGAPDLLIAARIRTFLRFTCWWMSKTVNFREGFSDESAHILAHQGGHSGMVSHHSRPNVR